MLNITYLRYWHSRYNKMVFDGKLHKPNFVLGEYQTDWVGACIGDDPCTIWIAPEHIKSLREARRVLLHEMVHQWQHESGLRMDHGRSFKQWEDVCVSLTGLPLWS